MKKCPRCGQVYTDSDINFCLHDGELLAFMQAGESRPTGGSFPDDAPPTLTIDSPMVTNQAGWKSAPPPAVWQNPSPAGQNQPFNFSSVTASRDQTLPTISLILGIIACFMVCCAGGIWLGLPAAVLGYLGMRNVDNHPDRYSGRGLAIAGLVLGIATFLASVVFLLFSAVS
jgi:hypothetical protein